jgi:hypothetical protein
LRSNQFAYIKGYNFRVEPGLFQVQLAGLDLGEIENIVFRSLSEKDAYTSMVYFLSRTFLML